MTSEFVATNAASSGIALDRKSLKALSRRSDRPGIIYLIKWTICFMGSGYLVYLSMDTGWVWPAMFVHGAVLSLPIYCLSHETAHGTTFRTRWLNETVFWISSLLYFEEPLHRRYTHTNHHTYTWHTGKDSQISNHTRITLGGWIMEGSGIEGFLGHIKIMLQLVAGKYSTTMKEVIPENEFPRIRRNAIIFLSVYIAIGVLIALGVTGLLWYLVIPLLFGLPVVTLFGIAQHVELEENSPSIVNSTRSFATNSIVAFFYMNMHHHCEHHLYPQVPYFALPQLHDAVKDQLPKPDPGIICICFESLIIAIKRTLGMNTTAKYIRQSPTMVTDAPIPSHSKNHA